MFMENDQGIREVTLDELPVALELVSFGERRMSANPAGIASISAVVEMFKRFRVS